MTNQEKIEKIVKLLQQDGITSEMLDDATHDCAAAIASAANNEGLDAQVELMFGHGWTSGDILFRAEQAKQDADEEQRRDEKRGLYADKIDPTN